MSDDKSTLRGLGPEPEEPTTPAVRPRPGRGAESIGVDSAPRETKTRTLRGMGPTAPGPHVCACCQVKCDEPPPIDAAIAAAFGMAIVFVRGASEGSQTLCSKHYAIVRSLVDEMRSSRKDDEW